jgi:hypothetical protein
MPKNNRRQAGSRTAWRGKGAVDMREKKTYWILSGIAMGVLAVALVAYLMVGGRRLPDGEFREDGSMHGVRHLGYAFTVQGNTIRVHTDNTHGGVRISLTVPGMGEWSLPGTVIYRYRIRTNELMLTLHGYELDERVQRTQFGLFNNVFTYEQLVAIGGVVFAGTIGREQFIAFERKSNRTFIFDGRQFIRLL